METHKDSSHTWSGGRLIRGAKSLAKLALIIVTMTTGCAAVGTPRFQPAIEELAGTAEVGKELTINGSQFTETEHGVVIADSGDSIRLFEAGKVSEVEPEQLWNKLGSPWAKPLERTPDRKRGHSRYRGKGKSYNGYLKALEDSGNDSLFVSWRLKLSDSPGHSKGSNKFIRIWDKTNGKGTRISWTQMHMTYSGGKKTSWGAWPGDVGEWNQMSLWVDSENGDITAWVNDKLAHSVKDFRKADTEDGLNIKLIGFDPNRSTPYKSMEFEIDDLYVSAAQARVVVSDRKKWSQAQARQSIQIPTTWRDSEIRFVYQPADWLDQKRYLYVVNAHGEANPNGYALADAKAATSASARRPQPEDSIQP